MCSDEQNQQAWLQWCACCNPQAQPCLSDLSAHHVFVASSFSTKLMMSDASSPSSLMRTQPFLQARSEQVIKQC
jgi:hypothetical protein